MSRIIQCCDCGQWEEVVAANAKRCYVCRLVTNIEFIRERRAKCWLCDEKFCPIARDDQLCANCARTPAKSEHVDCVYCGEHKPSVAKDIAVCMACARDVRNRRKFHKALKDKQAQRADADPGPRPITAAELKAAEEAALVETQPRI